MLKRANGSCIAWLAKVHCLWVLEDMRQTTLQQGLPVVNAGRSSSPQVNTGDLSLWHRRLGHPAMELLQHITESARGAHM